MLAELHRSLVLVIDVQPNFLNPIHEAERVLRRARFLVQVAKRLEVPMFVTEQYPGRMGGTHPDLLADLGEVPVEGKMEFSGLGCPSLRPWLREQGRDQVILVGIETHICVNQTAHQLLEQQLEVFLAEDALSARSAEMHAGAMARMTQAGAIRTHTESVVYEWMRSAEHAAFRDVLKIVKEA